MTSALVQNNWKNMGPASYRYLFGSTNQDTKVWVFLLKLPLFFFLIFAKRCSVKKVFLKISQNSQKNNSARVSFLIKLGGKLWNFIKKEALAQMFVCDFREIIKNTFFIEHLRWLVLTEKYLESSQTFMIEFFRENSQWLLAKKVHHRRIWGGLKYVS